MRYIGILVGVPVTIVLLGVINIAKIGIMSGSGIDVTQVEGDFWWTLLFSAVNALAPITGGLIAGTMARHTRERSWIVGSGAVVGAATAVIMVVLGAVSNSGENQQVAGAGDLLPVLVWPLEGAFGGLLVWLATSGRRK
ncbi:hypothetical protein FHX37_0799 [Haloactinospora alba]|uniref:Uncharacterized protein n=1 Tax=Haloactinospora alba TaxID=405555 RepID=A0A543NGI0_9ACTN|nr:hypothetical protein [Haloactinospora alba]TQN30911.1 hypothetical protein FHX37_0799 [Haloactinospora alba]